jgi:hypothetical protein
MREAGKPVSDDLARLDFTEKTDVFRNRTDDDRPMPWRYGCKTTKVTNLFPCGIASANATDPDQVVEVRQLLKLSAQESPVDFHETRSDGVIVSNCQGVRGCCD